MKTLQAGPLEINTAFAELGKLELTRVQRQTVLLKLEHVNSREDSLLETGAEFCLCRRFS